ncbi:NAC domain-containing protein 35-like [Actinidia eriantha]|uniref:NAC domain-containing protein 35-like n=1 Tax=Actinidia eriantha TaxID=165200 RepID=UPI0025860DF6|nr:NAC domain-containing protein 35-like [Actinidia eriantha]
MAIAATTMSSQDHESNKHDNRDHDDDDDEHEHDLVMPGFRFHPTEEELIEFYLRRKVEGKRFAVELITFLDLYRYDPWELPAMATIGEKEWYFYVPRDRKYRNGDRPNRVTTSGYWKATGADRMIRSENFLSIGLKKTLVFYSGKAPKGIRTSWIMNEYRLPQQETERLQKAEISLCRVYKRPGVEDHPSVPRSLPTRASSSRATQINRSQAQPFGGHSMQSQVDEVEKMSEASASSSTDVGTSLGLSNPNPYVGSNLHRISYKSPRISDIPDPTEYEQILSSFSASRLASMASPLAPPSQEGCPNLVPNSTTTAAATVFTSSTTTSLVPSQNYIPVDDLHRLINLQQASITHQQQQQQQYFQNHLYQYSSQFSNLQPQSVSLPLNMVWDWNSINEGNKDFTAPFK